MDSNEVSGFPLKATLFPAYSSAENKSVGETLAEGIDKEWLCNKSFNAANCQEAVLQQKLQDSVKESKECFQETEQVDVKTLKRKIERQEKKKKKISQEKSSLPKQSFHLKNQLQKLTFIEETGLSHERAYLTDTKYDGENRLFDCFERTKIAKYRLKFQLPYGLSLAEKSFWPHPSEKKAEKSLRYFSKKALKMCKTLDADILDKGSLPSNYILDFIPLSFADSNFNLKSSFPNFYGISVEWKSDTFKKSSKSADNEDSSLPDSEIDKEVREKTISFNRQLADSPHNIKLWLDFVDFQDEILNSQRESCNNKVSEHGVIEKKIAILEKAVSRNPSSVNLLIARLNLCKDSWNLEDLTSSWENLLFLNPHDPKVWQQYLIFILTNLKYFSTQRILKLFSKCIRTLSNLSEGIIQSHKPGPDIIYSMIEIFSQFCYILQSSGYAERAIASYQALFEFNFFPPPSVRSLSVSERSSLFEPFWDSGAARFGEDGAIGWSATMVEKKISSEKIISESDLNNLEDDILVQNLPLAKTWCEFERLRELHHWLPWRPNPEYDQTSEDVDDLDRTVSFDDVSKILFHISDEKGKLFLLLKFINFLGFNIHEFSCTDNATTNFQSQINLDKDFLLNKLRDMVFSKQKQNPFNFIQDTYSNEKISFVNNVFAQAIEHFSFENRSMLSRVWLKCQKHHTFLTKDEPFFKQNMENLKTFAKSMLQKAENRNCLPLWLEFIEIESFCNSKSKANKTFEKLLMSSSAAVLNGSMRYQDIWFFLRSYVEWCMRLHDDEHRTIKISHNEIIWWLLQIGNKTAYVPSSKPENKPASILKAAKGLRNLLDQHLQEFVSDNPKFCACLEPHAYATLDCLMCVVYFCYLTQGFDGALAVFSSATELLELKLTGTKKRYILEHLAVLQAELINFHTWNTTTASIKPLKNYLYEAVKKFPYNPQLLYLSVKLRCASAVVGHTRRFFYKLLNKSQVFPTTWIFAITSELSIIYSILESCNNEGTLDCNVSSWGINWKIRTLYEKALQSQLCSHMPIIWRSYIKFEVQCGDVVKAKSIYHRALQLCVWSKELHMDAIECFPEDLQQIVDLMNEKQIRIHTPLEEVSLLMEHAT